MEMGYFISIPIDLLMDRAEFSMVITSSLIPRDCSHPDSTMTTTHFYTVTWRNMERSEVHYLLDRLDIEK